METNNYELDGLEKAECETCGRAMLVIDLDVTPECQNCYITKLEIMEKEKRDKQEHNSKIVPIKRAL